MANSYELVGKVSFVRNIPEKTTFGEFIAAIRRYESIYPLYLYYCLSSNLIQQAFRDTSSQTTNITNISLRSMYPLPLPLSPLARWEWVRVGNIADHRLGKMLDKNKNRGSYYPYLRNLNVQWLKIDLSDIKQMRFEADELKEFQLEKDDLLICEGGEPGRCAIWNYSGNQMIFQKAIHRVRLFCKISSQYLLYHIWCDANSGNLESYFTGATIKHFTGKSLANYVLALPPLAEQQRIVERVEQLLALCDDLQAQLAAGETARVRLLKSLLWQAGERN